MTAPPASEAAMLPVISTVTIVARSAAPGAPTR